MERDPVIRNMGIIPQSDLKKFFLELETQELFQNVKEFIKDEFGKEVVFSEHEGLNFIIEHLNTNAENPNTNAEIHLLDDPTNLVSLSYGLLTNEDGRYYQQAKFQVVIQENSQTVIKKAAYSHKTKMIEIYTSETIEGDTATAWAVIDKRNKTGLLEDLKKDANAVNAGIKAQGIFDFCLAGGYQYCGKGCGSCSGCDGGGDILNKVDGCCYVHDDCYRRYSTNRCANCDWALVHCVNVDANKKEGPVAADAITLYFTEKCGYVF